MWTGLCGTHSSLSKTCGSSCLLPVAGGTELAIALTAHHSCTESFLVLVSKAMLFYVLCVSITEKPAGNVHCGTPPHSLSEALHFQEYG